MMIKKWLESVTNPHEYNFHLFLENMETKIPRRRIAILRKVDLEDLIEDNDDGRERFIELNSDEYLFEGTLNCFMNGSGCFTFIHQEGFSIQGPLQEGCLHGLVIEKTHQEKRVEAFYYYGRKQGYFREFQWDNIFLTLGKYQSDRKEYPIWKRCSGNSYLIHISDKDFIYLYPDINSCIAGSWEKGAMLSGKYGTVEGFDITNGIRVPRIGCSNNVITVGKYDPSTGNKISSNPLLTDPFEDDNVYILPSSIGELAGEGLYAKKLIPSGSLVCLFNGIRKTKYGLVKRIKPSDEEWSDYRLTLDKSTDLDVPLTSISLESYKATLGHKACHCFEKKNAKFENLFHPRFGEIMSILATKDILPNEEVFVNYNYNLSYSPDWYLSLWKEFKAKYHSQK
ncbi:histone-lysine N-methyltransferase SETD7 isoform X5 [Lepeophtheirus salmonis]